LATSKLKKRGFSHFPLKKNIVTWGGGVNHKKRIVELELGKKRQLSKRRRTGGLSSKPGPDFIFLVRPKEEHRRKAEKKKARVFQLRQVIETGEEKKKVRFQGSRHRGGEKERALGDRQVTIKTTIKKERP